MKRHTTFTVQAFSKLLLLALFTLLYTGCTTPRPRNVANVCSIFMQYPRWYWAAQAAKRKWGVPIPAQMAIIYQESRFNADAQPPRERLLWIIPWFRPTSAYGYSQALDGTWATYERQTGNHSADRDAFSDAVDFIGWFANRAHRKARIPRNNTRLLYLAYHEGIGGYLRGTYKRKLWLIRVAKKVQNRAWTFSWQLKRCASRIPKKPWWRFW